MPALGAAELAADALSEVDGRSASSVSSETMAGWSHFQPNPALYELYDAAFARFATLHPALKDVFARRAEDERSKPA